MGFFDNILGSDASQLDWNTLTQPEQLDALITRSYEVPVVIFKHSIRCGISAMVKAQMEADWDLDAQEVELHYLDLINYRSISNLVVERLGVWHQSPQLILLKGGQAAYHASHQAIRVSKVKEALAA